MMCDDVRTPAAYMRFYSSEDGREPVAEFLDSLDSKMSAKLVGLYGNTGREGDRITYALLGTS